MVGPIAGGPGRITMELPFVEDPLVLELIGARAEFAITETVLANGVIGGAVAEETLDGSVVPALHRIVVTIIERDCKGTAPDCCTPDTPGEALVDSFDADEPKDCEVGLDEFKESSLLATSLAPDVDMLDASGDFAPGSDGVDDSVSVGLGFSATGASFELP